MKKVSCAVGRHIAEIQRIFAARGCHVVIEHFDSGEKAGGVVFIYAPGVEVNGKPDVEFTQAPFTCDDGVRAYSVWLITVGEYIPATTAEYNNARIDQRVAFGEMYFVKMKEMEERGNKDLVAAFEHLGV